MGWEEGVEGGCEVGEGEEVGLCAGEGFSSAEELVGVGWFAGGEGETVDYVGGALGEVG